jgi:hypothetical protein
MKAKKVTKVNESKPHQSHQSLVVSGWVGPDSYLKN